MAYNQEMQGHIQNTVTKMMEPEAQKQVNAFVQRMNEQKQAEAQMFKPNADMAGQVPMPVQQGLRDGTVQDAGVPVQAEQAEVENSGNDGRMEGEGEILIDTYRNMLNNPDITGQAHHLNQDAAFRDVIPKNEGLCVELEGNAFRDIGSPHYSAHKNLEDFWNDFRLNGDQYGDIPTILDYNLALYDSLRSAGLTDAQAKIAVQNAIKQQSQYGLDGYTFVPRIPGRINYKKNKNSNVEGIADGSK